MSARYRAAGVAGGGIRARSSIGGGPGPCLDDIRHAPQMRPSPGLVRTASHCGSHRPDAEGPRGGIIVARYDQSSHGTGSAGRTNGALQRFPRFIGWVCDDRESRVGSVGGRTVDGCPAGRVHEVNRAGRRYEIDCWPDSFGASISDCRRRARCALGHVAVPRTGGWRAPRGSAAGVAGGAGPGHPTLSVRRHPWRLDGRCHHERVVGRG